MENLTVLLELTGKIRHDNTQMGLFVLVDGNLTAIWMRLSRGLQVLTSSNDLNCDSVTNLGHGTAKQ